MPEESSKWLKNVSANHNQCSLHGFLLLGLLGAVAASDGGLRMGRQLAGGATKN